MTEEAFPWSWVVIWRSIGLSALCGATLGAALVIFLLAAGVASIAFAAVLILGGAMVAGVDGLAAGVVLVACGPVVRRSRIMASLMAGVGAAVIPLAVSFWLLAHPRPHAYGQRSLAVTVAFFAGGAALGPLAVAGTKGWSARSRSGPSAS